MAHDASLTRTEFLVMAVLADEPLHGYGIAQEIQERTQGRTRIRPGSLYRVLDRLQARELLERAGSWTSRGGGDESSGHERRTYYRLTKAGRQVVVAEAEMLSELAAGLLSGGDEAVAETA